MFFSQQPACGEFLKGSCLEEASRRLSYQEPTRLHRLALMDFFPKEEVDKLVSQDSPMHALAVTLSERPLMKRVIQKDPDAFEEVYMSQRDRIYHYIYHRTGQIEESEDLTGETFFRLWRAIDRGIYKQEGPIGGYLFRIAHNLVASNYRDKKGRQVNSLDDGKTGEISAGDEFEAWIERKFTIEELRRGLNKLSPLYRQVIVMRYIEELTFAEIADTLRVKEGTARVRLQRGLKELGRLSPNLLVHN